MFQFEVALPRRTTISNLYTFLDFLWPWRLRHNPHTTFRLRPIIILAPSYTKAHTRSKKTIIDRSADPLTVASLTEHRRRWGLVEGRRGSVAEALVVSEFTGIDLAFSGFNRFSGSVVHKFTRKYYINL